MKIAVALSILTLGLLATGCGTNATASSTDTAQRGAHLVRSMGCHDCHTPLTMGPNGPEPDMTKALMGHPEQIGPLTAYRPSGVWLTAANATNTAFAGPWGISYAANLTSDTNTGLGIWTEDMFLRAIRTGRHMGTSRPINPPMPWPAFRNATDEDLRSIFAYLKTVTPIVNHVPDYQPPAGPTATN